ncbi:MAG: low molecular weight phosphotyrosine protein phosphatase [Alphaproteobacteria bacterium]|nr:low molecular weight phosphotyrosine protein phosphatase [Alphaproteobacteria bacterium]
MVDRGVADKLSVLFVCLGNICRSPLAEAAFRAECTRLGLDMEVDSAGLGDWHAGSPPDPRAQAVARKHGADIGGHKARQVTKQDFRRFDHIVALDHQNYIALARIKPASSSAHLSLLLDYVEGREGQAVADPYYEDAGAFEKTWVDVEAGAKGLMRRFLDKA